MLENKRGIRLEVDTYYSKKESSKFIILSVAFGTRIDYNSVYRAFAEQAANQGYNTILYSYTGAGRSEGIFSQTSLKTQVEDLASVIEYARKEKEGAELCLAGHSLGSSVSVLAYLQNKEEGFQDIKAIISLNSSINTENLYKRYIDHYENTDKMTYEHKRGITGETVISGRAMWESFNQYDPMKYLSSISVPMLAVFGDKDDLKNTVATRKILTSMPNVKCEIISGCDHEFTLPGAGERVIAASMKWLKENF